MYEWIVPAFCISVRIYRAILDVRIYRAILDVRIYRVILDVRIDRAILDDERIDRAISSGRTD